MDGYTEIKDEDLTEVVRCCQSMAAAYNFVWANAMIYPQARLNFIIHEGAEKTARILQLLNKYVDPVSDL